MLIRRMYLSIKRECVTLIFFLFCGFLFTETRKETDKRGKHRNNAASVK